MFKRTSFLPNVAISGCTSILIIRYLTLKVRRFGIGVIRLLGRILTTSKVGVHKMCRHDSTGRHEGRNLPGMGNFVKTRFSAGIRVMRGTIRCVISIRGKRGANFFLSRGCGELTVRHVYGKGEILSYFARVNAFTLGTKVTKTDRIAKLSVSRCTIGRTARGTGEGGLSSAIGFHITGILSRLPQLTTSNRGCSMIVLSPPTFAGSHRTAGGTVGNCHRVGVGKLGLIGSNKFLTAYSYSRFVARRLLTGAIGRTTGTARGELHRIRFHARKPSRPVL